MRLVMAVRVNLYGWHERERVQSLSRGGSLSWVSRVSWWYGRERYGLMGMM